MLLKKWISLAGLLTSLFAIPGQIHAQTTLKGSWEFTPADGTKKVVVATSRYLMQTTYSASDGRFIESLGGPYALGSGSINVTLDFHSSDGRLVGNNYTLPIEIKDQTLVLTNGYAEQETWHRLDDGKGPLAGCWQITQRRQDNKMHTLPEGDRKTLKLLSGKHFQWTAFNTATGEFSGCGGGHYTFEDGKYTEHIDFFSRDDSRVGLSLSFDDAVKDSLWHHKGKSTQGAPVDEIWKLR